MSNYFGQPVASNTATLAVFGNSSSPVALPHPLEFVGKTFENGPELFAKLPIFNPVLCPISQFITPYVHGSLLPGEVPSNASYTWDWQTHCAVPDEAIKRAHHESAATARVRFVKKIYARLTRIPGQVRISGSLELDTYCYRTEGEVSYCDVLYELNAAAWTGDNRKVAQSALCWDRPILRSDFRFASKEGNSYWEMVAWERRMRYRTGRLIPYHCIESEGMTSFARENRYVRATPFWERLETSQYCTAELPPIVTYMSSYLIDDPNSGWWTVVYTEFVARQAVFVLWDVYDSCRLWRLLPKVREFVFELNLSFVLGSRRNYPELKRLVRVMDELDWGGNALCAEATPGYYSKLWQDYVLYDARNRTRITIAQAEELREQDFVAPESQAYGYVFLDDPASDDEIEDLNDAQGGVTNEDVEMNAPVAGVSGGAAAYSASAHPQSVKDFLHDVGFDSSALEANYHELVSLVQACCGFPVGAPVGDETNE